MLLRFAATNFRSIREQQELSLIATALRGPEGAVSEIPRLNERVLRAAAIYGPNASGKSNILRAIRFMTEAVINSQASWKPQQPILRQHFELDTASHDSPTSFEVDFLVENTRYHYGFAVDTKRVLNEWLYTFPYSKRQLLFSRSGVGFKFGKNLNGENKLVEKVTRPNSLFLSAAAQNNHEQLSPLYTWFATKLVFVNDERRGLLRYETITACKDETKRQRIEKLLRAADVGLIGFNPIEQEMDDRTRRLFVALRQALPLAMSEGSEQVTLDIPDKLPNVEFLHRSGIGEPIGLGISSESAGTVALFGLLGPIVDVLDSGGSLFVDELDSSLHPLLALEIVRLFNSARNSSGAQLVFNTHDTNLLDPDILRRDQVWFTEKDDDGATHLYPLTDFKSRADDNVKRGYLQGRYGAVPFLGSGRLIAALTDDRADGK